jgi:hypothetical protein
MLDETTDINISTADKKVIQQIVTHYKPGERVRVLRNIFKHTCSTSHYLYLGLIIGSLVTPEIKSIHKMRVLSYLN